MFLWRCQVDGWVPISDRRNVNDIVCVPESYWEQWSGVSVYNSGVRDVMQVCLCIIMKNV